MKHPTLPNYYGLNISKEDLSGLLYYISNQTKIELTQEAGNFLDEVKRIKETLTRFEDKFKNFDFYKNLTADAELAQQCLIDLGAGEYEEQSKSIGCEICGTTANPKGYYTDYKKCHAHKGAKSSFFGWSEDIK